MATASTIWTRGLRKSYGDHVVLDGIDLDVAEGSIFSLLGPNGSGKTTTVQILSTLIGFDGGEVQVAGHDLRRNPDAIRGMIGVTGQFSAVDGFLTGEENLRLMADLHNLRPDVTQKLIRQLLERFDIVEAGRSTPATYSGGMRRRLDLAMTLVGSPRVIFLDEPTAGLDPRSRRGMWDIVRELAADGVTIFLTTQYLEEADQLADRIAVLDHGRIIAQGTSAELKRLVPGGHLRLMFPDIDSLAAACSVLDHSTTDTDSLTLRVPSDGSPQALRSVLDRLGSESIEVATLAVHTPDLDDVFLALTGRPVGPEQTAEKEAVR